MCQPLAVQGMHHLAVPTRSVQAATSFYETVMGFESIARPDFSFDGAWLVHPPSGLQFHIIEHHSAPGRGAIDTLAQHFAMIVPDLDQAEALLKSHQVEYRRQVNAGGFQQIFFQDPDGNTVEVGVYP
jgi:catechol 2,3-dioxygenase-like lactoylglutathione lyase family enzyme